MEEGENSVLRFRSCSSNHEFGRDAKRDNRNGSGTLCQLFQESLRFELFMKPPKAKRSIITRNNGRLERLDTGLVDYG